MTAAKGTGRTDVQAPLHCGTSSPIRLGATDCAFGEGLYRLSRLVKPKRPTSHPNPFGCAAFAQTKGKNWRLSRVKEYEPICQANRSHVRARYHIAAGKHHLFRKLRTDGRQFRTEGHFAQCGGNSATTDGNPVTPSTGRYRCMRSEFTLHDFEAFKKAFWLMPTSWRGPGTPILADLKHSGGAAAVSILPWLGRIAASPETHPWPMSAEELARVCGVDPKSIRYARKVLQKKGYLSTVIRQRHGVYLLHWKVDERLVASSSDRKAYFFFSFRILYGGHWAVMSAAQRAVYLAAGTLASVHREEISENHYCRFIARRRAISFDDIEASRLAGRAGEKEYRLAFASYAELSRISGYNISTVMRAVRGFKHPRFWKNSTVDADALSHCPVWVYPTPQGNSLLYHFRDHVRPWPWAVENADIDATRESRVRNHVAQPENHVAAGPHSEEGGFEDEPASRESEVFDEQDLPF
jgi:hypothetical protein